MILLLKGHTSNSCALEEKKKLGKKAISWL